MYESLSTGFSQDANSLTRFIKIYDEALSKESCEFLMKEFDDSEDKYDGKIWTDNGPLYYPDTKNVQQVNLEYDSEADRILSEACSRMLETYANTQEHYPASAIVDAGYHIKKYATGEGYFNSHVDCCCTETAVRTIVILFYLNDVEEGGLTEFDELGIACPPVQGRCLIFPAFYLYPHTAHVPISGPKYISNIFVGYAREDAGCIQT